MTFTATGADYGGVSRTWTVEVRDDDYSFIFAGRANQIDEGSTDAYTVKLSRQPPTGRTVTTASGDTDVLTVSTGASLTFTTSNWNTPKGVVLSAVQDSDGQDHTVNVTTTATSFDTDVHSVSVTDDDTPRLILTGVPDDIEEGTSASLALKLGTQPSANVTVTSSSNDTGALTVSPSTRTYSTSNWNSTQAFTIQAVEDDDICLLYTSPSPRDRTRSRMPSSA